MRKRSEYERDVTAYYEQEAANSVAGSAMLGGVKAAGDTADQIGKEIRERVRAMDPSKLPAAWAPPDPEPPIFVDVNAPLGLTDDFQQLVESFFREEVTPAYARVERSLTLGDERSDFAAVSEALDKAEDNARIAHRLFVNAKVEQRRFDLEKEALDSAMHREASASLEEEKRGGARSKAPTLADIRAKIHQLHRDEFTHLEIRAEKVKRACDHLEQLADLAKGRCRSLQTILMTLRK